MRVSPKGVGIAGREFAVTVRGPRAELGREGEALTVASCPDFVEHISASEPRDPTGEDGFREAGPKVEVTLRFRALRPGRGLLRLRVGGAFEEHPVPLAVFRKKEYFLCMVISSNYHYGWDPLCYLFGNAPEQLSLEGDAYPKTRQLEAMYHQRGLPITWLIDRSVAEKAKESVLRWHEAFGDDYGVMPPSFFHHNPVNYNIAKSPEETTAVLRKEREAVEALFPFWTDVAAIDQWMGSVGTNWVRAAYELGFAGLWGVGFDHVICDTSMYHRGVPFEAYKPDRENYRLPARHASSLWVYQWTTRDIINAVHTPEGGAGGSTIFSTDPDDVRLCGTMAAQRDYWNRLLGEYRKNLDGNDFGIFLLHQEDHDCHFPENADYLREFLDGTRQEVARGDVMPATLEEVAQWLNLRYRAEEHPRQVLEIEDPLAHHEKLEFLWVVKPDDWPGAGEHYPTHVAFFDREWMFFGQYPESTPFRSFDYGARYPTAEDALYPEERLPRVVLESVRWLGHDRGAGGGLGREQGLEPVLEPEPELELELVVTSDKSRQGCPVLVWDYPEPPFPVRGRSSAGADRAGANGQGAAGNVIQAMTKKCLVARLNLKGGRQVVRVRADGREGIR